MSLHFNAFSDNNDHDSNSEFFDNSLQQPYYDNVLNTTSDYVTVRDRESTSTSNVEYHQASLQHDEHIQQNDFTPTPHHDNASAELSIPKVSKRFGPSQNQILKIEFEIVIKLQNDQTQQRTHYDVRSSTLPKNRTVNRE
jgi:Tfp pilus assembly protein PilF